MDYIVFVIIYLHTCATNALQNTTCVYLEYTAQRENVKCSESYVCNKSFTINYIDIHPYTELFSIKNSVLSKCCGKCVSANLTTVSSKRQLNDIIRDNSPDFIYPILHRSAADKFHNYYFIPVIRAPSFIYVTPMPESSFFQAVRGCLNLYPLLIICLLMSLCAGFVVWSMEIRCEQTIFPKSFPLGWVKGIWWSSITLVSSGLERNPTSIHARIFSVIWIVIGVTMLGLLTSSITAMMVKRTPTPDIKGARVGALKYRLYDEYMITKHGGTLVQYPNLDLQEQYYTLLHLFRLGEIDSVLFDKYVLAYTYREKDNLTLQREKDPGTKQDLDNFMIYTAHTEKIDDGEVMSYGILVKEVKVYEYFSDAIKENWIQYETIFASYSNNKTGSYRKKYVDDIANARLATIFSPSDPFVYYAMAGFGANLIVIGIIGMIYEKKRTSSKSYSTNNQAMGTDNSGMVMSANQA